MNISIFGLGYVGAVTAACLVKSGHTVYGVDPDLRKLDLIRAGKAPILEEGIDDLIKEAVATGGLIATDNCEEAVRNTSISLVAVGTPSSADGSLSTSYVVKVCEEIGAAIKRKEEFHSVVIRSTVLPGTTNGLVKPILEQYAGGTAGEKFGLAMNPEFLREGTSVKDFYDPPYTLVGTESDTVFAQLAEIYKGVGGSILRCSLPTAEAIKYACNLLHATKVTFGNEIGMLCEEVGVDSREVMEIVCQDTKLNISPKYLKPGFAFGGSCLPKDLRAFNALARIRNAPVPMLNAILESNRIQVERAAQRIIDMGKRRLAIFGLSFKEGTDDLRESPMVALAEMLIGKGYEVVIYDPNVEYASLFGANKRFIESHLPHLKRALVSAEVALEAAEIVICGHRAETYTALLPRLRADQLLFDLVGICEPQNVLAKYEGLYW